MKVNWLTLRTLTYRRQKRYLLKAGYIYGGEVDWKIARGGDHDKTVTEIILGVDGNSFYYKKELLPPPPEMESVPGLFITRGHQNSLLIRFGGF